MVNPPKKLDKHPEKQSRSNGLKDFVQFLITAFSENRSGTMCHLTNYRFLPVSF